MTLPDFQKILDTEVGTEVEGNTIPSTSDSTTRKTKKTIIKKRNWFLTINNYTEIDIKHLENIKCRYIIWQKEVGEKCGTPHIHATIVFDNAQVWPKKTFPTAKIEIVKNLKDAIKYCSKVETRVDGPFERGDKPQQGKRNDLEKIAKEVIDGKKIKEIANDDPEMYVRYSKGLKLLREEIQEPRDKNLGVTVVWLWGNTGVGKTRIPNDLFNEDLYIKDGTQWWDNYDHEKCILIDDFDGKWPFRDFLRLLDRYKYQGQFKGGYTIINSAYIFITCEFEPSYYWEGNTLNQVLRRIKHLIHLEDNKTYEENYKIVSDLVIETY